jgi:hypothetical protein
MIMMVMIVMMATIQIAVVVNEKLYFCELPTPFYPTLLSLGEITKDNQGCFRRNIRRSDGGEKW